MDLNISFMRARKYQSNKLEKYRSVDTCVYGAAAGTGHDAPKT